MTDERFDRCVEIILQNEGGYVNDPADPGGETNFGISKRSFPDLDIKSLTREYAKSIYKHVYWRPLNLSGVENINSALQVFDHAVNTGLSRSTRMAQLLAGVRVDGIIGPVTIEAINTMGDVFLKRFIHARKEYYRDLADRKPVMRKFLQGWLNRVDHTKIIVI